MVPKSLVYPVGERERTGDGTVWQDVPVSWTTIKAIYKHATALFGSDGETA